MFRVPRIMDDALPLDRRAIAQVQAILRSQFRGAPEADVTDLPTRRTSPIKYRFRTLLFVADNTSEGVKGFAMVSHDPDNRFLFLDYIASGKRLTGAGVGGALYQRVRDEARELGLDTDKDDPTGTWSPSAHDLEGNGRMIGALRLPTLVVQEGGYTTRTLGVNARRFFTGLAEAPFGPITDTRAAKGQGRGG